MNKIKMVFDGWHCFSKRHTKAILKKARTRFRNANFSDNTGLLIEHNDELEVHQFCLDVIEEYSKVLKSWDGYEIKRISKRILINFADRKRKLSFSYFKKLVCESDESDTKLVLAGILYLEPDDILRLYVSVEKDFGHSFKEMEEAELRDAYRLFLMYSSSKARKFSLNQ